MNNLNQHQLHVTKRNGQKELIQLDKIHRVLTWAAEGLDVSVSATELKAHIQFYDGMPTKLIHEMLIKTAADMISEDTPDYQYYAAKLAIFHLRKKVFGKFEPWTLQEQIDTMVQQGRYDSNLLTLFSAEEIAQMDQWICHERDLNFAHAAIVQLEGKYLVQDRVEKTIHETPQFLYMLVAACLFSGRPADTRMNKIRQFYDATSTFKISLPTPIMAGVRTKTRQYSSCVLIEAADSLDSINAAASSIVKYVSQRAGIGIGAGAIRGLGSKIRGGEAEHTGCIPFFKYFLTAVKSCSQGGVRGGSATLFYPFWHIETPNLLVLKNNRGVEDNRVRGLDYGVQLNKFMYQRLQQNGSISLFSPSDVPGLYDAFFADQDLFNQLYLRYENDPSIRKKTIPAAELFSLLAQERAGTGRIFIQNVDHCNTHSPFIPSVAPIRMSNLCLEIALPTKPLEHSRDPDGEIALCTLAALNLGEITSLDDIELLAQLVVEALDALLDYQDYPVIAARNSSMARRTLGVGAINLAYYFAKNGVKYSDGSANKLTHETFEAIQYYLLKASNNLAKEKGACPLFHETTYSQGILPIDTYKKSIDSFANFELLLDWESLRKDIVKYGLRNSTLTALMPSETSSQISNATNGIEPPRGYISSKNSKDGIFKQVVPELKTLKDKYELVWDIPNNRGYLQLVAIMQKFVDQAISANTNYDPSRFENGKVPMKVILGDLMEAYSNGLKTLYYHNTRDGQSETLSLSSKSESDSVTEHVDYVDADADDDCAGGACKI
jgi:ribonucleoside-diphosphate reductase alpha chain